MGTNALAQPVPRDAKLEAKARFMSGQSHYNLNELPEALADFKDGYRLFPDPVFLFNLGQCERQLGHFDEAIRFYRNFLREQPKAANRQEVLHKIEEMEAASKSRPAEADKPAPPLVAPAPEPAKIEPPVQGPAEPAPTPAVAPQPEVQPAQAIIAKPSETATNSVSTPAAFPTPAPVASDHGPDARIDLTSPAPEPAPAPAFYRRWWFWTAAGVVAVGAGLGIYAATSGKGVSAPTTDLGTKKVF
jgi:hypothetical protein